MNFLKKLLLTSFLAVGVQSCVFSGDIQILCDEILRCKQQEVSRLSQQLKKNQEILERVRQVVESNWGNDRHSTYWKDSWKRYFTTPANGPKAIIPLPQLPHLLLFLAMIGGVLVVEVKFFVGIAYQGYCFLMKK